MHSSHLGTNNGPFLSSLQSLGSQQHNVAVPTPRCDPYSSAQNSSMASSQACCTCRCQHSRSSRTNVRISSSAAVHGMSQTPDRWPILQPAPRSHLQPHSAPHMHWSTRSSASTLTTRSFSSRSKSSGSGFSSSKSSKPKVQYECQKCGAVYLQWQGKCRNCNEFGTVAEHTIQPTPTSTAAHVQALLQGSSSSSSSRRTTRSTSSGSSWSAAAAAAAAAVAAPPAGVSDDFADAAADPYNTIGPDYDNGFGSDDDDAAFGDTGPAGPRASSSSSRLAGLAQLAQSGAWVSGGQGGGRGGHTPRRLSDMVFEAKDLRVPLYGATGEEVSRVLGGGVVPGSVVLVGGEPGKGKSTLLLQLAALMAQTCQQQQQPDSAAAGSSGSDTSTSCTPGEGSNSEEEEDVPLAQRAAAAAAAAAASSSSGLVRSQRQAYSDSSTEESIGWMQEAAEAAVAAAAVPEQIAGRPVLYVTAEESDQQVWERAKRLGIVDAMTTNSSSSSSSSPPLDVRLLMAEDLVKIIEVVFDLLPAAIIIDSIQTVRDPNSSSRPGSVSQVRDCARLLAHITKELGCATFLVGHVTKDGSLAGPKNLEHLVDVVLSLEGVGSSQLRMLRALKNRFGRAGELGIFEMRSTGLEAVTNAAALFVPSATVGHQTGSSDGSNRLVGTAIAVIQDGARPLPIEVQALVAPRLRVVAQEPAQFVDDGYGGSYSDVTDGASDSEGDVSDLAFGEGDDSYEDESSFGSDITGAGLMRGADKFVAAEAGVSPREVLPMVRSIVGLPDRARMGQLLELLTRYTPIKAHQYNIYVNVVAGVTLPKGETLADLPLLAAVASSVLSLPLPPATALMGEVGLGGELRVGQQQMQMRVLELAKLGFEQVIIPTSAPNLGLSPADLSGLRVLRSPSLWDALVLCFGAQALRQAGRAAAVEWKAGQQQQQQQQQQQWSGNGSSNNGSGSGSGGRRRRIANVDS